MTTSTKIRHLTTAGDAAATLAEREPIEPGPGEVRIRVAAAPVNPVDPATRDGAFHAAGIARGAVGLGWDLAGTVDAVGDGVEDLRPGDEVIAIRDDLTSPIGAQSEQVVLPVRAVGRAPRGVEPAAAATLALNALTARQALDLLGLPQGATLLITGAAGAVGGFAVELAKLRGLRVVAQASDGDAAWLRSVGADETVGRDGAPPAPVDGALDAAGIGAPVLAQVRNGGVLVAVTDPSTPPAERGIRVEKVSVHAEAGQLDELAQLAEDGRLTLRPTETYPLERADEAYRRVEQGGLRGRVVLIPA